MDLNELENIQDDEVVNIDLEKWEAALDKWKSMTGEEAYEELYKQGKQDNIPLAF